MVQKYIPDKAQDFAIQSGNRYMINRVLGVSTEATGK